MAVAASKREGKAKSTIVRNIDTVFCFIICLLPEGVRSIESVGRACLSALWRVRRLKPQKVQNPIFIGEILSKLCAMEVDGKADSQLEVAPTWNTGTCERRFKQIGDSGCATSTTRDHFVLVLKHFSIFADRMLRKASVEQPSNKHQMKHSTGKGAS